MQKRHLIAGFLILLAILAYFFNAYTAKAEYEDQLPTLRAVHDGFRSITSDLESVSTARKTQEDWNKYYDSLISEVGGLRDKADQVKATSSVLVTYKTKLKQAAIELSKYLNVIKAYTDQQFRIDSDRAEISSRESDLSFARSLASSFFSNRESIQDRQRLLSDANNELVEDQKLYDDLSKQAEEQFKVLETAASKVRQDEILAINSVPRFPF